MHTAFYSSSQLANRRVCLGSWSFNRRYSGRHWLGGGPGVGLAILQRLEGGPSWSGLPLFACTAHPSSISEI